MSTSATMICDSVNSRGDRLMTIEVRLRHYVAKELLTHRAFSRGAASHRAIPLAKTIESILADPAIPPSFGTAKKGMQTGPALAGEEHDEAVDIWLRARDSAIAHANLLDSYGVHKSITNRLLEPFAWATYIVTASEWDGFWHQRCHPDAEESIREAACVMRDARDASTPVERGDGEWHLPYIDANDWLECQDRGFDARQVSVARVARVSYLNHHGERDLADDVRLYNDLVDRDPMHAGPLEHVATPADPFVDTANLSGWVSLRTLMGQ